MGDIKERTSAQVPFFERPCVYRSGDMKMAFSEADRVSLYWTKAAREELQTACGPKRLASWNGHKSSSADRLPCMSDAPRMASQAFILSGVTNRAC
jgi:hypothetical protein